MLLVILNFRCVEEYCHQTETWFGWSFFPKKTKKTVIQIFGVTQYENFRFGNLVLEIGDTKLQQYHDHNLSQLPRNNRTLNIIFFRSEFAYVTRRLKSTQKIKFKEISTLTDAVVTVDKIYSVMTQNSFCN